MTCEVARIAFDMTLFFEGIADPTDPKPRLSTVVGESAIASRKQVEGSYQAIEVLTLIANCPSRSCYSV